MLPRPGQPANTDGRFTAELLFEVIACGAFERLSRLPHYPAESGR